MSDSRPLFSAARQVLSIRNFAVFSAGNVVSLIGTWTQRVAVGWVTWDLTGSATWLGAVAMAEFLPVVVVAPIVGVFADRYDRRRIAVIGQALATVQAVALAALTITGHITPLLIFLLQLFSGLLQPLIQTARLVLVPTLVPRALVGTAVAITSLMFNIARIIGPALAGILITTTGAGLAFAFNAITYIGVIFALSSMVLPPHEALPRERMTAWAALWRDMSEGWRYTFKHPTLNATMILIAVTSTLTWPLGDLMAGISDTVFGRGAEGLAILTSAQGVGAIIGGLFLAQRSAHAGIFRIVLLCLLLSGIMVAAFALMDSFWIALPILSLSSVFGVIVGVGSQTVTQTVSAEHMRARALSVWFTITRAGPAVGAIGLGVLSHEFGFTWPLFAAGALTAVAATIYLLRKRLVKMAELT